MDHSISPPPYNRSTPNSQTRSASRLARITHSAMESEEPLNLSLDLVPSSPKKTPSRSPSVSLKELLLLSPSPLRKSRTRLSDRLENPDEGLSPTGSRRRCKTKGSQLGLTLIGCASPRNNNNNRRTRRRSETETREEKDIGVVDEIGKGRKRKHTVRSKKEKPTSVPCNTSPKMDDDGGEGNLDRIGLMFDDLIMWRDVAKSSLWFGIGCLCFLSSCFTKGVNFSIFSAISQLGLLFLAASFFSTSILQRNNDEKRCKLKLKEEDILRLSRLILPATNLAISKTRELFSGEPSMTLKVLPFLVLGAEYGHLITIWRLCALGFFISFTVPKLYSCYFNQINHKVENVKDLALETWGACSRKKVVVAAAAMAFWNLSTVKTRILTAFISLVVLRYCRQHLVQAPEEVEAAVEGEQQEQEQQALVVASRRK